MKARLIIDADAHVSEPVDSDVRKYMRPEFQNRPIRQTMMWDATLGGTLGKSNYDPVVQLKDMDAEGIDIQVIYPSILSLNTVKEPALATDRARAYNEWLAHFCAYDARRLKAVAQVALQDVEGAVQEARRAVEELGHVAIMVPTNALDEDIGKRKFWPLYAEAERLGVPVAVHGGIPNSERMHGRFNTFLAVHTVSMPLECMAAMTGLIYGGVPEAFPRLKLAILEGCVGWVPFLMDRMDEEFELRGSREAPLLRRKPSEYIAGGQFFFGFEIEESTLPFVISRIGSDKLLYASDYPHWDSAWPNTVQTFLSRSDISDGDKNQILADNPLRLYGLDLDRCPQAEVAS